MGESERSSWQVKFDLDEKVSEYTSSQVFLQGKTDNFFSGLAWTDLFKCTIHHPFVAELASTNLKASYAHPQLA